MGESKWCGSMAWQHYAAKHPHQSVEDGQPFEMGPKEVKHMQKVAMSVHAPVGRRSEKICIAAHIFLVLAFFAGGLLYQVWLNSNPTLQSQRQVDLAWRQMGRKAGLTTGFLATVWPAVRSVCHSSMHKKVHLCPLSLGGFDQFHYNSIYIDLISIIPHRMVAL